MIPLLTQAGYFVHHERLGTGHTVAFEHISDVVLYHDQLYYINLHLINYVGYESYLESLAVHADFLPPFPGYINATSDEWINDACENYVPEEWRENRCFVGAEHTPVDNHRFEFVLFIYSCSEMFNN